MSACWLCGEPIEDPPVIIGCYVAGQKQLAHRHCLRVLGELELDLTGGFKAGGPVPAGQPVLIEDDELRPGP
jgi:hypothetical protein